MARSVGLGGLCSFLQYYAMPAMLIYSIFMLVESIVMLSTMLTLVAKKAATSFSGTNSYC